MIIIFIVVVAAATTDVKEHFSLISASSNWRTKALRRRRRASTYFRPLNAAMRTIETSSGWPTQNHQSATANAPWALLPNSLLVAQSATLNYDDDDDDDHKLANECSASMDALSHSNFSLFGPASSRPLVIIVVVVSIS